MARTVVFFAYCLALLLSTYTVTVSSQNSTSSPTSTPSYGPSSSEVVDTIMFTTLGGIVFILILYFYSGHYLYQQDVDARIQKKLALVLADESPTPSTDTPLSNEESPLLESDEQHIL